ncbi:MAG: hypothetical protein U9Q66_04440, partial [Patescibacteria group bacterium]|nr:hypothetical protein [Patescibacteria group bacterium]
MFVKFNELILPTPEEIEGIMSSYKPDKSKKDLKVYVLLQRLYVMSRSFVSDRNNILEVDVSNLDKSCSLALNEKYPYLGKFCFAKWMQKFVYNPDQAYSEISILLEEVKKHYLATDHFMLRRAKVNFLKEYSKIIIDSDFKKKEDIKNIMDVYLYENSVVNYTRTDLNHNKYLDKV